MAEVIVVTNERKAAGLWRTFLRSLLVLPVVAFAFFGVVSAGIEVQSWYTGNRWTPGDIEKLLLYKGPLVLIAEAIWADVKFVMQYGSYFIASVAFAAAVLQIKTVSKLVSDFNDARAPIYTLAGNVTRVADIAQSLTREANRLSTLQPTIQGASEKMEDMMKRFSDMQRAMVSERDDTPPEHTQQPPGALAAVIPTVPADDELNWQRLRELWNANGDRLEAVIDRIPDKKLRSKMRRMPWTNYATIINTLGDAKLISEAVRTASLGLNSSFMRYRRSKGGVTNAVIGSLIDLDKLLEHEIGTSAQEDAQPIAAKLVENELVPAV